MVQLAIASFFSAGDDDEDYKRDDEHRGELLGGEQFDHDRETGSLLTSGNSLVREMNGSGRTVDCARGPAPKPGEVQTVATPPLEIIAVVPEGFQPGIPITVPGPHGSLLLEAPVDATPGAQLVFMLGPLPDFQITVPAGVKGGMSMHFMTAVGDRIAIHVPEGLYCGDVFPVTPPALMVQVPEGAKTGDSVVFCAQAPKLQDSAWKNVDGQWFRATVPDSLVCGYFAARLPKPQEAAPRPWHEELQAALFGL